MLKVPLGDIAIISVKHTGTNFISKILEDNEVGRVRCSHWLTSNPNRKFIISPIRDPYETYITWYSRGRFGPDYYKEWEIFNEAYLKGIAHIVPVDISTRKYYLDKLSEEIGIELKTNWKKVEHQERFVPPSISLKNVYDLPVVKRYYEE